MNVSLISALTVADVRFDIQGPEIHTLSLGPGLGILSLAAVLEEQGTLPRLVDLNRLYYDHMRASGNNLQDFSIHAANVIAATASHVFGFSTICTSYPITLRIASHVKRVRPDSIVVFGGPQASVVDRQTLMAFPFVDFVLRGEAERTLPVLLSHVARGEHLDLVPSLTYRDHMIVKRNPDGPILSDLDILPSPAYHLLEELKHVSMPQIELGRGCPFACTFCSTNDFFRRRYRLRSAQRVLADMRKIASRSGQRQFDLVHDMFTVDRKKVIEFCHTMLDSGERYKWSCSARTDCVDDELLALMARSGCSGLFFGIETGSERIQKQITKDLDLSEAQKVIAVASDLGISTTVSLICGFPDETWSDIEGTLRMFMYSAARERSRPQLYILSPLADTPLHRQYAHLLQSDAFSCELLPTDSGGADITAMVEQHADIFPNFYFIPTPHLDRSQLVELREFMFGAATRLRWLLVALDQCTGSHLLEVFVHWRNQRLRLRPNLDGSALARYYHEITFRKDFVTFLRDRDSLCNSEALRVLIAYHDAILTAAGCEALATEVDASDRRRAIHDSDMPIRPENVTVFRLDWDLDEVVRQLLSSDRPQISRRASWYVTQTVSRGEVQVASMSHELATILTWADGVHRIRDIKQLFYSSVESYGRRRADRACMAMLAELQRHGYLLFRPRSSATLLTTRDPMARGGAARVEVESAAQKEISDRSRSLGIKWLIDIFSRTTQK